MQQCSVIYVCKIVTLITACVSMEKATSSETAGNMLHSHSKSAVSVFLL